MLHRIRFQPPVRISPSPPIPESQNTKQQSANHTTDHTSRNRAGITLFGPSVLVIRRVGRRGCGRDAVRSWANRCTNSLSDLLACAGRFGGYMRKITMNIDTSEWLTQDSLPSPTTCAFATLNCPFVDCIEAPFSKKVYCDELSQLHTSGFVYAHLGTKVPTGIDWFHLTSPLINSEYLGNDSQNIPNNRGIAISVPAIPAFIGDRKERISVSCTNDMERDDWEQRRDKTHSTNNLPWQSPQALNKL